MSEPKKSTKTRLIEAALDLFAEKGVTDTTTKAVAEHAGVNEVTLFRHFGNKHGLLLAVIEDSSIFARLGKKLVENAGSEADISQVLRDYAQASLQSMEGAPQLIHSLLGEADRYPRENRLALGQGLTQANRCVATHLARIMRQEGLESRLSPEKLASLLNGLLLGYFSLTSTSEGNPLWASKEDFLDSLLILFLEGAIANPQVKHEENYVATTSRQVISDLPAHLVRSLFIDAKKLGKQEYALIYVLFGAGLSVEEIVNLKYNHFISQSEPPILQVNQGRIRQVPLNQWIMGKRYGSAKSNPLTQWLKVRVDGESALFINEELATPITTREIQEFWTMLTEDLLTPQGELPTIEQARQTWIMDMLLKGIELENLSILSGFSVEQLQPFAHRAKEKSAIEQAYRLDNK